MTFSAVSVGPYPLKLDSLPETINDLEDNSVCFVSRFLMGDSNRATKLSIAAVKNLDFISNELFREKTNLMTLKRYSNSEFERRMKAPVGRGVTKISRLDQEHMVMRGAGNGRVPYELGNIKENLSLGTILNKIKHRHKTFINFRLEQKRHIFVICTEDTDGGSEGIYEFDILNFCRSCREAYEAL